MRGVICYYSATGNTRLACEAIVDRLGVPFDLVDVIRRPETDLAAYDVVGFASSTDFWSVPHLFGEFMRSLPQHPGKPAFVFNTFGGFSGKTLLALRDAAAAKGFDVLAGHSLHMPESYPPMVAMGLAPAGAPSRRRLARFDAFVSALAQAVAAVRDGRAPERIPVRIGFADRLFPALPRTTARRTMGEKYVDESACTACGGCERRCPYGAIRLDPKPVFDAAKCYGCWRCFNTCPERAIHTRSYAGKAFYPGPAPALRDTLAEAIDPATSASRS
ncbi:MAG TPA: EFR1 family ferrodoxin [Coriobacteriia bacterium]|jgi:ferredoxin/flavodoxin